MRNLNLVARRPLLLLTKQTSSAGHALVRGWMSGRAPSMPLGPVEALKGAVASNLGMAILPEAAVCGRMPDIVVQPLRPPLSRTQTLI
jgi:DNA-binding transcriptional LysR family regulator